MPTTQLPDCRECNNRGYHDTENTAGYPATVGCKCGRCMMCGLVPAPAYCDVCAECAMNITASAKAA